jgi:hypothetical protein
VASIISRLKPDRLLDALADAIRRRIWRSRLNRHRRLHGETYDILLPMGEGRFHTASVQIVRNPRGEIWELNYVGRGKQGHGLDDILHKLGIGTSRAIQGRDPNTGDKL